jgi:multiple sugar transport system permease protein
VPLAFSFYLTFTKWDLLSPNPEFIGFQNWSHLFQDPKIPVVLGNTAQFIAISTTSYLFLSLLLALLLAKPRRGISFLRGLFFLPWVLSPIAVSVAWTFMFNQRSGPIGLLAQAIGIDYVSPLLNQNTAMIGIAVVATWQALGYGIILYIAGLQGIPKELYDAARVDGANVIQRFIYVEIPLLSPTILFLTMTAIIAAFQLFDLVVILAGPAGSTDTIVYYIYQQMFLLSERLSGAGYAATLSWMLAILVFIITIVQWSLSKRWVFYFGE